MKFLISLAAFAALTAPATAEAHNNNCGCDHARTAVSVGTPAVTVVWIWVPATRSIRAHWSHPVHGREFTNRAAGRPLARPHVNATWVTGHWTGNRRTRHWVSGHWNRQSQSARSSRQARRSRR